MSKYKTLLAVFAISLFLIFLAVPLAFPVEGGIFLIGFSIIWFGFQLWRYATFRISSAFVFMVVLVLYLIGYAQLSPPTPITHILVQRTLTFLMLAILISTSLRSHDDRLPWENALIILAIIVSTWSLVEMAVWYYRYMNTASMLQILPPPEMAYRPRGNLFGHPNPLAGFLNFVWPIVFIRLYREKIFSQKLLGALGLALFLLTIYFTNSRGALMGTLAGMVFLFLVVVFSKVDTKHRFSLSAINKQRLIILSASLGVVILLAAGMLWRSTLTGQAQNRSFSGRGTIWKYSWQAFTDEPIIGQGIAAFPISYTRLAQLPPGDYAPSAHNLLLQVAVDYGLIGFIFLGVMLIAFAYSAAKKLWIELPSQPQFPLAYLAGGIAFLAQQMVDFMLVTTIYLVLFILVLILITRYATSFREWELNRKNYAILGGFVLGLWVIYQTVVSSTVVDYESITRRAALAADGQWEQLQQLICATTRAYPENALYQFDCSMASAQLISQHYQQDGINQSLLDQALSQQQSGYNLNPYWMTQEANLAVLYWIQGERAHAIEVMQRAADAAPAYELFWLNLGWMQEQIGNQNAALDAYTRALRLNPFIVRSVFMQKSALISQAAEDLTQWAASESEWPSWYDSRRHDRSKYDQDYWKGGLQLTLGQTQQAVNTLETALKKGSVDQFLYTNLTYAYQLNGQTELAFHTAQDVALLHQNNIRKQDFPTELSIIASILYKNGETDQAYDLLLEAYQLYIEQIVYRRYYAQIYAQQSTLGEISPWLVRTYFILTDTQEAWNWFAQEAARRGDPQLSQAVKAWLIQLDGIARLPD